MRSYCKGLKIDEGFVATAYGRWLSNEAGRRNSWRVCREHGSPETLCAEIAGEIRDRTLCFAPIATEARSDGRKPRDIGIEPVKQQVCGYVVDAALDELMRARLGYWQVSTKGKSVFRAAKSAQRWMRSSRYHVHLDVRKCYDSLKCRVVMCILKKYVKSDDVLFVAERILESYPGGHLMIGSYLSMRLAHLALSFGYHHVESLHKARRRGKKALVSHQVWYADDVWLFSDCKRDLKSAVRSLGGFLRSELGLEIKPWKVCRVGEEEPCDLAGICVRPDRTSVRARTFLKARRALLRFRRKPRDIHLARRVLSYWGWLKHTDSSGFCARKGVYGSVAAAKRVVGDYDRRMTRCLLKKLAMRQSPARCS